MATTLKAREGEEVWQIQTEGRIWLQKTKYNRFGQPITSDFSVGPKKSGQTFRITIEDRAMNQENIEKPEQDPFRNGMLVRVDADQNVVEETKTDQAYTTEDLLKIFDKHGNAFQAAVNKLDEIPVRRLLDLAEAVDATAKQVNYLNEVIEERYAKGYAIGDVELAPDGTQQTPERKKAVAQRGGQ